MIAIVAAFVVAAAENSPVHPLPLPSLTSDRIACRL